MNVWGWEGAILLQVPHKSRVASMSVDSPGQCTALQTNLGVSFESTMTFISENVTLNFTESNEVVKKKIYIALFEKIDFFHFWLKIMSCCKN